MQSQEPIVVDRLPITSSMVPANQTQNQPLAVSSGGKMLRLELPQNKGDLLTNYRQHHPDDQVDVSRAMSPCDCNLDQYIGKTIAVVGVVLNMAEFQADDGSGELVERVYASIVLDDGKVVGTSGKAVMGQLAYLVRCNPDGPISPPAVFEVRQHPVEKPKKPYYSLRRVRGVDKADGKGVARGSK